MRGDARRATATTNKRRPVTGARCYVPSVQAVHIGVFARLLKRVRTRPGPRGAPAGGIAATPATWRPGSLSPRRACSRGHARRPPARYSGPLGPARVRDGPRQTLSAASTSSESSQGPRRHAFSILYPILLRHLHETMPRSLLAEPKLRFHRTVV